MVLLWIIIYQLLTLLTSLWRLLRRPRFPGACMAAIGISLICLSQFFYDPFRSPGEFPDTLGALALWFWLIPLTSIQLVLLGFVLVPGKEKVDERQESDRFGLPVFNESFLGRSDTDKL